MLITGKLLVLKIQKDRLNMATTAKASSEKIKLLDQWLEDLAGDEYEDYDADGNRAGTSIKHHSIAEDLDAMEIFH